MKAAILGFGTVGRGTYEALRDSRILLLELSFTDLLVPCKTSTCGYKHAGAFTGLIIICSGNSFSPTCDILLGHLITEALSALVQNQ